MESSSADRSSIGQHLGDHVRIQYRGELKSQGEALAALPSRRATDGWVVCAARDGVQDSETAP